MEYETTMGAYRHTGENYIKNLYETARGFYDKFLRRSREITQSLLGNYDSNEGGGGSSAKYMERMPPRDHRVQEYFS